MGAEPLIEFVVVMGAIEYLDDACDASNRYAGSVLRHIYERHRAASGI